MNALVISGDGSKGAFAGGAAEYLIKIQHREYQRSFIFNAKERKQWWQKVFDMAKHSQSKKIQFRLSLKGREHLHSLYICVLHLTW